MAKAKPLQDRTKVKFFVRAHYKLYAKSFFRNATRNTLEECYQWLNENKTILIPVTCDAWKEAVMFSYVITKNVTDVKVIDSKNYGTK